MDFKRLWMMKKAELINVIEDGKEAEKAKEYTVELHEKVRAGERAEDELISMVKAELLAYHTELRTEEK